MGVNIACKAFHRELAEDDEDFEEPDESLTVRSVDRNFVGNANGWSDEMNCVTGLICALWVMLFGILLATFQYIYHCFILGAVSFEVGDNRTIQCAHPRWFMET